MVGAHVARAGRTFVESYLGVIFTASSPASHGMVLWCNSTGPMKGLWYGQMIFLAL
jgi:hypothetical protein